MKQFLVILRGIPASGKSTIAKKLRNFGKKIVWLKVDNFKDFFGEETEEQLVAVNKAALSSLEYLFSKGYTVIMDGVFQDLSFVDEAVRIAEAVKVPTKVFQLIISLEVAQERDKNREGVKEGYREPIKDEVFKQIFERLSSKSYSEAIKIDVENNSLPDCLSVIKNYLDD